MIIDFSNIKQADIIVCENKKYMVLKILGNYPSLARTNLKTICLDNNKSEDYCVLYSSADRSRTNLVVSTSEIHEVLEFLG